MSFVTLLVGNLELVWQKVTIYPHIKQNPCHFACSIIFPSFYSDMDHGRGILTAKDWSLNCPHAIRQILLLWETEGNVIVLK